MTYRLATQEDYPAVKRLIRFAMTEMRQKFGQPDISELIYQLAADGINRGEAVFVAETPEREIIGCVIWVGIHGGVVETGLTYVSDAFRGKGHGTHLRELATDHSRKLGYSRIEGLVRNGNEASASSLRKIGFRASGTFFTLEL